MPRSARAATAVARLLVAVVVATSAASAETTTWPGFRGAERDGIAHEPGLAALWPEDGPPVRWRRPLGAGFSGVAVVGERAFTLEATDGAERLVAVATADGSTVWTVTLGEAWRDRFGDGPRSTPTVADGVVYALGSDGTLVAVSAADGTVRWRRDLVEDFGGRVPQWGMAASPLLENGLLVVVPGGRDGAAVVALDPETGEERWRALDHKPGYAAPIAATLAGTRQIVVFTAKAAAGLAPADGDVLWSVPWKTSYDVNAATPIPVGDDRLYVSSGYDTGAALYRLTAGDDGLSTTRVWRSRVMKNQYSSPVLIDGVLYGFDDNTFKAVALADGEMRWRTRGFGHGSLIASGGLLFVLGDRGQLALVEATPDSYRELSRTRVLDDKTWAPPSLAAGSLYIRGQQELVSLRVAE